MFHPCIVAAEILIGSLIFTRSQYFCQGGCTQVSCKDCTGSQHLYTVFALDSLYFAASIGFIVKCLLAVLWLRVVWVNSCLQLSNDVIHACCCNHNSVRIAHEIPAISSTGKCCFFNSFRLSTFFKVHLLASQAWQRNKAFKPA